MKIRKWTLQVFVISCLMLLVSCGSTVVRQSRPLQLPLGSRWAILPFINHTESPQAGLRVSAMVAGLLQANDVHQIWTYKHNIPLKQLLTNPNQGLPWDKINSWARQNKIRFAITGTVSEWRYKVGIDGEPVVGVTMQLIDLSNNSVIWSSVGSKTGWSRSGLSNIGQRLLNKMLTDMMGKFYAYETRINYGRRMSYDQQGSYSGSLSRPGSRSGQRRYESTSRGNYNSRGSSYASRGRGGYDYRDRRYEPRDRGNDIRSGQDGRENYARSNY